MTEANQPASGPPPTRSSDDRLRGIGEQLEQINQLKRSYGQTGLILSLAILATLVIYLLIMASTIQENFHEDQIMDAIARNQDELILAVQTPAMEFAGTVGPEMRDVFFERIANEEFLDELWQATTDQMTGLKQRLEANLTVHYGREFARVVLGSSTMLEQMDEGARNRIMGQAEMEVRTRLENLIVNEYIEFDRELQNLRELAHQITPSRETQNERQLQALVIGRMLERLAEEIYQTGDTDE